MSDPGDLTSSPPTLISRVRSAPFSKPGGFSNLENVLSHMEGDRRGFQTQENVLGGALRVKKEI